MYGPFSSLIHVFTQHPFVDLPCTNKPSQKPGLMGKTDLLHWRSRCLLFLCHLSLYSIVTNICFSTILKILSWNIPLFTWELFLPMQVSPRIRLWDHPNSLLLDSGENFHFFLHTVYWSYTVNCYIGESRHLRAGRNFKDDVQYFEPIDRKMEAWEA